MKTPIPYCPLHPATIFQIKKKHPWVTRDKFSANFPREAFLVYGTDHKGKRIGLFLHDPDHPQVVGRLWKITHHNYSFELFCEELSGRIDHAFKIRAQSSYREDRENIFLVFGEADLLPGLEVLLYGNVLIVRFYHSAWKKVKKQLIRYLKHNFKRHFSFPLAQIRLQERNKLQRLSEEVVNCDKETSFKKHLLEHGIKYQAYLDSSHYDLGLYTDAAALRKKMIPLLKDKKNILNLFSYTGAFGLLGLKYSHAQVSSVDLSQKNMEALERNIKLNSSEGEWEERHHIFCQSVQDFIQKAISKELSYDFIIYDPPPSSFDGKKKSKAMDSYEKDLPQLLKLLDRDGLIFCLLNTRSLSRKKFIQEIKKICQNSEGENMEEVKLPAEQEDCPSLPSFPEGDYFKVICLKRVS